MTAAIDIDTLYQDAFRAHCAGDLTTATKLYQRLLQLRPKHLPTLKAFGILAYMAGATEKGIEMMMLATKYAPNDSEAWANYGNALRELDRYTDSATACAKAVELDPRNAHAQSNLAAALRCVGRPGDSIEPALKAVKLKPNLPEAHINLASGFSGIGDSKSAFAVLSNAAPVNPGHLPMRQILLFTSLYNDDLTDQQITALHSDFGALFGPYIAPVKRAECKRIGFVSGDFRKHPVGRFFATVMPHLQAQGLEVYLYANQHDQDQVTADLKKQCDKWTETIRLDDQTLSEQIRQDQIDVLVDLSGHSANNRLPMFALKPCAVQATWLGYSSTTGLAAMDWFIGDTCTNPAEHDGFVTEQVARLTGPFLCDTATEAVPDPLPHNGFTFGSFNNTAKMSDTSIALWSEILLKTGNSKLVLKYGTLQDPKVRESLTARFAEHGITADRLEFLAYQNQAKHEAFFRNIDLCLDTSPYTGATTTMDAIKGGAPVLTLAGKRYSTRMSASILHHLGVPQLIAHSKEEFVQTAIRLAENGKELTQIRREIQEHVPTSSLFNPKQFATNLASLLRQIHSA